ncbi:MAG: YgfZ/GcvT domain-containing protein [Marinosulfonomonas sp.]
MAGEQATGRSVFEITGKDSEKFLQDLVTNDVAKLQGKIVYAALLSPQGKYLADFFLTQQDDTIFLDVATDFAPPLVQRLNMYKLRADVSIAPSALHVLRGVGTSPEGALADPRHPDLGWRLLTTDSGDTPSVDWDALRVAHMIPETGVELIANETYILEAGFEALSGVDFKKGCYVGQEVTARMKHKTELRKGLATVTVSQEVPVGTPVLAEGRPAGTLYTQAQGRGIAYLRFDRAQGDMTAGDASVVMATN